MKLKEYPIFADENVMRGLVDFLHSQDFNVKWVREEGYIGWKDPDLLPIAFNEGREFITQDSDFGKLVFTSDAEYIGIIYLRPGHYPSEKHIETIRTILSENPDLEPPFVLTAVNNGEVVKLRLRNSIK